MGHRLKNDLSKNRKSSLLNDMGPTKDDVSMVKVIWVNTSMKRMKSGSSS